ncbi:MAG: HNH endonuclease family protein [Candidatus Nanopelagicales bacterium]
MTGGPLRRAVVRGLICGTCLSFALISPVLASERRDAVRVLDALPVSPEQASGYDRDLFRHWSDLDGDGCNTREQVLIDERKAGQVRGCDVMGGRWRSVYDGDVTSNPSSFDIDHYVPLKEAWDSGAWRWNAATRERFANDLGYAGALIAVSASSNRSKSDRDPAEWLPERGICAYAKTWIAVKFRWRLAVDTTEKSALRRILQGCSPMMRVPTLARVTTR